MAPKTGVPVGHDTPLRGAKRRTEVSSAPWLRTVRRAVGLTQKQLAAQAGVDHSCISMLESGKRDIRSVGYETVVLIAAALNVTPDELFPLKTERSA